MLFLRKKTSPIALSSKTPCMTVRPCGHSTISSAESLRIVQTIPPFPVSPISLLHSSSPPNCAFLFAVKRSCFLSRAALFLSRLACISSWLCGSAYNLSAFSPGLPPCLLPPAYGPPMKTRNFITTGIKNIIQLTCSTNALLCLNVFPLLK